MNRVSKVRTWAKVTTQFEGYHCWPDAPPEVGFLRDMHRHMFHVTVWISQEHNNRDVEYILFKQKVNTLCTKLPHAVDASCEMMAQWIVRELEAIYPSRHLKVEVTEDGENGALFESEVEATFEH